MEDDLIISNQEEFIVKRSASSKHTNKHGHIMTNIPHRLDHLPFSWWHWVLCLSLGTSWVLDGLVISFLGLIGSRLTNERSLNLTETQAGAIGTIYIAGAIIGSLVFGVLSDLYGRKKIYPITPLIFILFTQLCVWTFSFWSLCICVFFIGFGVGGEYSAINSSVNEFIPARIRGMVDLAINGSYWIGACIGASLTVIFLDERFFHIQLGWRFPFSIASVLSISVVLLRLTLPESPRWLLLRGRVKEAEAIVEVIELKCQKKEYIEESANIHKVLKEIQLEDEDEIIAPIEHEPLKRSPEGLPISSRDDIGNIKDETMGGEFMGTLSETESPSFQEEQDIAANLPSRSSQNSLIVVDIEDNSVHALDSTVDDMIYQSLDSIHSIDKDRAWQYIRLEYERDIGLASTMRSIGHMFRNSKRRCFLATTLMVSQAFFYNAIFFSYALILKNFYGVKEERIGLYQIPFCIGNYFGSILLGPLFDKVGRKPMISATYLMSAILLMITGFLFVYDHLTAITQTLCWSIIFFVSSASSSSAYLTISEIFPMKVRALSIAIFYSIGTGGGGLIGPVLFGALVESNNRWRLNAGYLLGCFLMAVAAVVELCIGVSAEGKSLEQVQEENDIRS